MSTNKTVHIVLPISTHAQHWCVTIEDHFEYQQNIFVSDLTWFIRALNYLNVQLYFGIKRD